MSSKSIARQKPVDLVELLGVKDAPFDEGIQDGLQTFAERGEPVLDPLRMFGAGLSGDHPMFLERSQLLDQHLLSDACNTLLQIAGALRAIQQHMQDDRLPTPGENTQRAFDRQAR